MAGDHGLGSWVYLTGREALNSVRQETDAAGRVLSARSFDPYGVPLSGDGGAPFGFTGEYVDSYIKLQWLRARWLSVELGRFVQPDTIIADFEAPVTLNAYLYAGANPIRFTDATGYDPLDATWRSDFERDHGRAPGPLDEQIRLFSLAYKDEWVSGRLDVAFYNKSPRDFRTIDPDKLPPDTVNIDALKTAFTQPPPSRSWDTMPGALVSLSQHYQPTEESEFVRDVAFLYAGMQARSQDPGRLPSSYYGAINKYQLFILPGSINPRYIQTTTNKSNEEDANVHHWAWAFALGYQTIVDHTILGQTIHVPVPAQALNTCREYWQGKGVPDDSDVEMGNRGAAMGAALRDNAVGYAQIPALFKTWLDIG